MLSCQGGLIWLDMDMEHASQIIPHQEPEKLNAECIQKNIFHFNSSLQIQLLLSCKYCIVS